MKRIKYSPTSNGEKVSKKLHGSDGNIYVIALAPDEKSYCLRKLTGLGEGEYTIVHRDKGVSAQMTKIRAKKVVEQLGVLFDEEERDTSESSEN